MKCQSPLSKAKLESAVVDTGPHKLHDGAGAGWTSTENPEESFPFALSFPPHGPFP